MRSGQQRRKTWPKLLRKLAFVPLCIGILLVDAFPRTTCAGQGTTAVETVPVSHMQEPIEIIATVVAMNRYPWETGYNPLNILLVRVDKLLGGEELSRYVRVDFPSRSIYTNTEEYRVYQKLESSLRERKTWKMRVHPDPRGSMACAWKIPPPPKPNDLMMRWVPVILPVGGASGYPDINSVPCYVLEESDIQEVASPAEPVPDSLPEISPFSIPPNELDLPFPLPLPPPSKSDNLRGLQRRTVNRGGHTL